MRRELTLIAGILGVVLAVIGFEFGNPLPYHSGLILGCVGSAGSLVALWLQYREAHPFEYPFVESSWKPHGPDEVCLEIAGPEHGKGRSPSVIVYGTEETAEGCEEVICGVEIEPPGTVRVVAAKHARFSGRAVIR